MSKKPFIISSRIMQPLVSADSDVYDAKQENRIQIIQVINGYLLINMVVEGSKIFWAFWHYQDECPAFSYLSLGFLIINGIWAVTSYYGFRSIALKNSRHIRIFSYTVIANFFIRILMYIICGIVMEGKAPTYATVTEEEMNNRICSALYPQIVYIFMGCVEAFISLLILFLLRGIIPYVQKWEHSQSEKYMMKTKEQGGY